MSGTEQTEAQWRTFRSQPGAFAHPRRIADAFGSLISDDVAARLGGEERFRDRLSAVLIAAYGLSEDIGEADGAAAPLVLAPPGRLEAVIRQAGAVYWARAIVGQIDANAVTVIRQTLGEETYAAAIAHRDLANSDADLPPLQELEGEVAAAGRRCLSAWCTRQPAGIGQRVRLKLPPSVELDDPAIPLFDDVGVRIVERLTA